MQLKAAMAAASILTLIAADHCRLIAPWTEAGGDQSQWWKLH
jgi:hypothetical protein